MSPWRSHAVGCGARTALSGEREGDSDGHAGREREAADHDDLRSFRDWATRRPPGPLSRRRRRYAVVAVSSAAWPTRLQTKYTGTPIRTMMSPGHVYSGLTNS